MRGQLPGRRRSPRRTFAVDLSSAAREALAAAGVAPDRPLVAAVSGGPDSMALLEALHRGRERGGPPVIVAHFNHRLRGVQSDADEAYVREQAEARGLGCVTAGADVAARARAGHCSIEEAGRNLRYDFLARVAADAGASGVATGHTLDDQAETVLLHMARGSGLPGLAGIRPLSVRPESSGGAPAVMLVRPLLSVTRRDTERYCAERHIVPRHDASNADVTRARNRVRHHVIPALAAINPRVVEAIARLADAAAADLALLDEIVGTLWEETASVEREAGGGVAVSLARRPLAAAGPALRRALLRRAYAEAAGTAAGLEGGHLAAMAALIDGGAGRALDLPGGVRFETRAGAVVVAAGEAGCPYPPGIAEMPLSVPGTAAIAPGWELSSAEARPPVAFGNGREWMVFTHREALAGGAVVRARKPGDRLQPLGMAGSRKLQDVLVDAGVPRSWRDRVPIVDTPRGIAWVAGVRMAEWARLPPGSRKAIRLRLAGPRAAPGEE